MITRKELDARLEWLKKELDQQLANLNMISGAIKDVEYWIEELEKQGERKDLQLVKER